MSRLIATLMIAGLVSGFQAPVIAQVYDKGAAREAACAEEPTQTRQEICLDRDLTRKDAALNEVYADLRKLMTRSDFGELRREQRAWLKQRDRCGRNAQCLRDTYTDRLAELEQMAENLTNPGKSHVELGCDGPGQVYRDGNCFTETQAGDGLGDGFVWSLNAQNEAANRGRYTARLRYAVPETDAIGFESICDAGSSGTMATTTISYDTSGRREGEEVNFNIVIDGQPFAYRGAFYGTNAEFGISGLLYYPDFNDPMWEAMASGQTLTVRIGNGPLTRLVLGGSGTPTRNFIAECKSISSDLRHQTAGSNEPSCNAFGQLKSKSSETPVTVTFVNRTNSYRSVMWLNFDGQPIDYANLNPGEKFTVNTYLTHPWMFTDGPGNCIELYLPKRNQAQFEIRKASPAFGPGND